MSDGAMSDGAMSDGAMSDGCKAKYEAHLKEILDLLTLSLIKKAFSKVRLKKTFHSKFIIHNISSYYLIIQTLTANCKCFSKDSGSYLFSAHQRYF